MKNESLLKKVSLLLAPLTLFPLLFYPYSLVNSKVIVDVFGCGCPVIDSDGNVTQNLFNANDFTACFWFVIAVATILTAFFQSKKIVTERPWLRVLYITGVAAFSFLCMYLFNRLMLWC